MIRKSFTIAIAAVAASICFALCASAASATTYPGGWYWTPKLAAQTLVDNGIDWRGGHDEVEYARCRGTGYARGNGGTLLFKHFSCFIETPTEHYVVGMHTVSEYDYLVRFLRYA
jgi:hypothetical protein